LTTKKFKNYNKIWQTLIWLTLERSKLNLILNTLLITFSRAYKS
jgi:hypothetical protein